MTGLGPRSRGSPDRPAERRGPRKAERCRQRVDHKVLQPRVTAGRQKLQHFDQPGEGDDEGRRVQPVAGMGQSERQSQQHKGKRVLAVLSEGRVRPSFRRSERCKRNGGDKAPGE